MSDCCAPGGGFPNASLMTQLALNHPVVWSEICMIQQGILAAASQCQPGGGQMCTVVGGHTPMTFISGVQSATVVSGGAGYLTDTPALAFIPPLGVTPTAVATGTVTTNGSSIVSINITDGGAGYQPVLATLSVNSLAGSGALIEPLVNAAGQIAGVNIVAAGLNYTVLDTITATRAVEPNAAYINATFRITAVGAAGEILSVAVLNAGNGYQPSVTTAVIVSTLNPAVAYPLGGGFYGTAVTDTFGVISQVITVNAGAGYATYSPYLVITDPGTGATTSVTVSADAVSSVAVITPGSNYTQSASAAVINPSTAPAPTTDAVVTLSVSENTFGTNPALYWQVWSGAVTNKAIQLQLNQVLSHFKGLGYTVVIQTNPATGNTLQWKICWM